MERLLIAAALATGLSLVGTRFLIVTLRRLHIGQPIRDDGPEGHQTKAGTPTMGGAAIVAALVFGYVVSDIVRGGIFTDTGIFVVLGIVGAGAVGFLDDLIKVTSERSLGLTKRAKMLGLLGVAVAWSVIMVRFTSVHTTLSFTRYDVPGIDIGEVGWVIWAVLLIVGSANAVNLTDGLDGLAAGSGIFGFAAFTFVSFWAFRHPGLYDIPHALDLAVVAAAMLGGSVGFMWWNAAPAQIFMGDTGSLAIGSGLAMLSLATNTQLLLPIIGGLFVMETVSVIVQVAAFRTTGRRVFRMAPVHHHFELLGWPETTVIVRFWLLAGFFTAVALGIYYQDFISTGLAE